MIFIENRFGEKSFSESFFPENSFIILVKTSSEPVLRSTFSALLISKVCHSFGQRLSAFMIRKRACAICGIAKIKVHKHFLIFGKSQ